jgi:hypothetical protein
VAIRWAFSSSRIQPTSTSGRGGYRRFKPRVRALPNKSPSSCSLLGYCAFCSQQWCRRRLWPSAASSSHFRVVHSRDSMRRTKTTLPSTGVYIIPSLPCELVNSRPHANYRTGLSQPQPTRNWSRGTLVSGLIFALGGLGFAEDGGGKDTSRRVVLSTTLRCSDLRHIGTRWLKEWCKSTCCRLPHAQDVPPERSSSSLR